MIGLQFTLTGRTAMFKQPDVNEFVYMTYGHIHKVAVYGMLGAMLGLNGYDEHIDTIKSTKWQKNFRIFIIDFNPWRWRLNPNFKWNVFKKNARFLIIVWVMQIKMMVGI